MQISSYMFQSPYSQPVQIGRPDPSMLKEQMQEAQKNQKKSEEAVSSVPQNKITNGNSGRLQSSGLYQTSEGMQQSKQAMESFQSANRNTYVRAYVENSITG